MKALIIATGEILSVTKFIPSAKLVLVETAKNPWYRIDEVILIKPSGIYNAGGIELYEKAKIAY